MASTYLICDLTDLKDLYNESFIETLQINGDEIEQFFFNTKQGLFIMNKSRTENFLIEPNQPSIEVDSGKFYFLRNGKIFLRQET